MESLVWGIRTLDNFFFASPTLFSLLLCFGLFHGDYFVVCARQLWRWMRGTGDGFSPAGRGERPAAMVIIPSLLRDRTDLTAFTTTLDSCISNAYPSDLVIIASVDGRTEHPELYRELEQWIADRHRPAGVWVYLTGTPTRLGKMMAVEAGVSFMSSLVERGVHPSFPELYFSIDGDGTLGDHALERLAHRITTPHPITGNPRRVVSGKICIRPDLVWRGWRNFFTVSGQIHMNVAREFLVSNVARFNLKPLPKIGIPGALYCTWSEIIRTAPRYMGFMQSLTARDLWRWWLGLGAPLFSERGGRWLPEALTGASDDTCIAFIASISRWRDGKLDFDAPRSPLQALSRVLFGYVLERSHDYEPEARVYTYTPSTVRGLWTQRLRWNSSRVECAGRFWRAFWFHWDIGMPTSTEMILLLNTVFTVGLYYVLLPYCCFGSSRALLGFVVGYIGQTIAYTGYTLLSLALERERRAYACTLLCLPLASLYAILINAAGCVVGVTRDVFLFGNSTNFAPEWTLRNGGCERIAILFRLRRFVALAVRSLTRGDVPLGWFWLGWSETPWTPSGYDGWTTKRAPRPIVGLPRWPSLQASLGNWRALWADAVNPRALAHATLLAILVLATSSCVPPLEARGSVAWPPTAQLRVTSGRLRALDDHSWQIDGEVRAEVTGDHSKGAELLLTYRGPSRAQTPLRSGELRRQLGLKLRAQDTCNVVYVMWHIEPSAGVFVSVKHNPGMTTHAQCGDRGYLNVTPEAGVAPAPMRPGERHRLRAQIDGARLRVAIDGELAWEGTLPAATWSFDGPVGLRADNGIFDVTLLPL